MIRSATRGPIAPDRPTSPIPLTPPTSSGSQTPPVASTARRVGIGVLVALLLMRTVLIFAGDGVVYAGLRAFGLGANAWPTAVLAGNVHIVVIADLVTLLALGVLVRRGGGRLRDLVGPMRRRDLGWGLLCFVILVPAFLVATYLGNLAVYHGAPPASGTAPEIPLWFGIWSITIMPITIALAEELLYRGYLQPALTQRVGRWPALALVAAGFGLQHAGLSALSVDASVSRVITTFLAGLVLGALRMWLKRLAPLIFAHWLLDVVFLGLPMLLAATGVLAGR